MNRTITRDIFQNSSSANNESVEDNLTGDEIVHVGFDWTYQATIYVLNSLLHFIFLDKVLKFILVKNCIICVIKMSIIAITLSYAFDVKNMVKKCKIIIKSYLNSYCIN